MLLCSEPSLLINIEKGWSLFSSKTFDPPFSLLDHTYLPFPASARPGDHVGLCTTLSRGKKRLLEAVGESRAGEGT